MAADPRITNAVASGMADIIGAAVNSGKLRIYDGTIPTNADTAVGAQTLLAELTMNADAFPAASNGVLTANAITSDASADATGTASWFRLTDSAGTTTYLDGTVGTSGEDMNLNTTSIVSGAAVAITSFTITVPKT